MNNKNKLEDLESYVLHFHETREKMKVLLLKIREKNLCLCSASEKWKVFLENNEILKREKYITPFSFLTDFVNPIAFHTHYGKYWSNAIYIGDSFIDDLKNSLFSKKKLFKEINDNIKALKDNSEKIKNITESDLG